MKRETWDGWLRAVAREGRHVDWKPEALGALTGQDARALRAIDACWALYACCDEDGAAAALQAVGALLAAVQPQCRVFARELVARHLDWHNRDKAFAAALNYYGS